MSAMAKKKIRVLVVDDSALVRQTLADVLSSDPGIEVMATACDPFQAAERIAHEVPDVITLDLEMARNFPNWGDTHWDYEKGNLNQAAKDYTVAACSRVKEQEERSDLGPPGMILHDLRFDDGAGCRGRRSTNPARRVPFR